MGSRGQGYRHCRRMAINMLVQQLCGADMYMRNGLHLSRKNAAVFADELSAAVDSGMGSIRNIFW